MTTPVLQQGGRVVVLPRLVLFVTLVALAGATACSPKGAASASSNPDAAVTVHSAVVTRPASWQNLWGSWPFQRYDHGWAYDSDRSKLVIFGGRQGSTGPYYTDTWEWDSARLAWNERTPAGNGTSPAERAGAMMAYDPVHKKSFLFSGWQPAAGFYISDQWEWDGTNATWTQDQTTGSVPLGRYGGAVVWDSDRKVVVLFGGFCGDNSNTPARCNDVWEWNGTSWANRTPAASALQPSPRLWHSMAYDASRKKMVVYGGYTGTGPVTTGTWVDETWEWDGSAQTWTKITAATTIGYPSYVPQLAYHPGLGKVVAYMEYNYMWTYDPTTPTWTRLATPTLSDSDSPGYQYGTFVYDTSRSVMLAFGGQGGYTRDLFEWDGTANAWTNRSKPVNGPIQRSNPAVAYDSKRGKTVLFGGYSSVDGLYKQDTWEWSGMDATWSNKTNANAKPVGRYQAQLVYDSKRDQFLLWGGAGTGVDNAVWALSGGTYNWSQLAVTGAAPPVTSAHLMFYDAIRDKVIVWIYYYNIWEFDPATLSWTQRLSTTTGIPTGVSNRSYYEVTFDSDRDKVLLVGGEIYQSSASAYVWDSDVWEWDPVTAAYTERSPAAGAPVPTGRNNEGLSYDSARRVVVMFGGNGQVTGMTGPLDDSWEWDGIAGTWTETSPPGVRPLPRYNHLQLFDSQRATTFVFGGTVPADGTYGPQEIWEYFANTSPRPNGSGCSASAASSCASGNCVDGVCCNVPAAQCAGTCMACNVSGKLGTCSAVPAGSTDDTCPSDQACDANQQCKAKPGHLCSVYSDCASGHCADGVCCNTDCNDTCKQCNLNSSLGTCALVPTGNEDPGTCASDPSQARYCDASGVCNTKAKPNGSPCTAAGQCASSYCIDGVCCSTSCTNTCYSCNLAGTVGSCYPIPTGQVDHSATTPCDQPMEYCLNGTCATNKKPNGQSCTTATDCGSGFCVDGYCCNGACTGTCQSCGVTGNLGSCVNTPAGAQDTNSTPTCTGTQYCDGKGTCQSGLKANGAVCAAGTECGSGNCVDGVCCDSTCTAACYACNLPSTVGTCTGVVTGATDGTACAAPNYCTSDHTCTTGKKANGATCTGSTECASGNCVDKTCCDSACAGTCQTCANATGTCGLVPAGMDLRGSCKGTDSMCGGTCDGQGACIFAPQGKTCRAAGCQTDLQIITGAASVCDGAGNCTPAQVQDCNGFGCYTDTTGAHCKTNCATDPDCAIKRYCQTGGDGGTADGGSGSQCPAQLPLGSSCSRDTQCQSGTCAINRGATMGTCCNTKCSECGTCDSTGNCQFIPAGTDPNQDCIGNASDTTHLCAGLCDGHAHCLYPSAGTSCGTCKSCNGSGLCNVMPDDDKTCDTVACSELSTSCLQYHDLTTKRCGSLGACKTATVANCTDVTNTCGSDGGAGAGGSGGSSGHGGSGGTTGAAGTSGSAGSVGTDAGTDGGTKKSGGGGCGCDLGGAPPLGLVPGLFLAVGIVTARRRRR